MQQAHRRRQNVELKCYLMGLENVNYDYSDVKSQLVKFFNMIILRPTNPVKATRRLLEARTHLNNCFVLTKNHLNPELNDYIKQVNDKNKSYIGFNIFLGIASARLDLLQKDLQRMIMDTTLKGNISQIYFLKIEEFRQLMIEYANTFIIIPYRNALVRFKTFEGYTMTNEKIIKDRDLFMYFLFLELYRTSEYEGAIARQIMEAGGVSKIKSPDNTTFTNPPTVPLNPRVEETEEESNVDDLINTLNDPYAETEISGDSF